MGWEQMNDAWGLVQWIYAVGIEIDLGGIYATAIWDG